jgi:predicted dehydrogenase
LAGTAAWALGGGSAAAAPLARPLGANDDVRLAMVGLGQVGGVGVGGRGHQLIDLLREVSGARIVGLCDVDSQILDREMQRFAQWQQPVKPYADMRQVFDDPDVDAVFVATPNHWHALATVWACQAGKDVYVEKPASYSIWEGRQMVAAARKHGRIVQVGTQARSTDISAQAVEFIQSGQLGKILLARAIIYRGRQGIGKVDGPQTVPASVNYDLWLGPAPQTPPMRREFHYDWHWFWSTGNGEIGNNGVHYLDRCRWLLGQKGLPRRAMSVGGRFTFDDDGQTANTQIALLDYEPAPIICEVRNLPEKTGSKAMDKFRSIASGVMVQCEGGTYVGTSREGYIVDEQGRKIREFVDRRPKDEQESAHQANFVAAIRSRKPADLNAEVSDGHLSAALCHMANVSHRLGANSDPNAMIEATRGNPQWSDAYERFRHHLEANGVDLRKTPATLGPWVTMDSKSEKFVGEFADRANALSRREYREPFVVPEIV